MGGVHVDIPRRPGEAVSYAVSGGSVWKLLRWMQEGPRFQEWSKNDDQKRWEPGHAPVPVAICLLHFLFPRPL